MRFLKNNILCLLAALLCWAGVGEACSGIYPNTPQKAFERADSVFSGKVVSIGQKQTAPQYAFGYFEATVAVDRWWKGGQAKQVTVRFDESTCGAFLQKGQSGVIFANGNPPFTSALSGNVLRRNPAIPDKGFQAEYNRLKKQLGHGKPAH